MDMARRKSEARPSRARTKVKVTIEVRPKDLEAWRKAAKARGVSLSALIRAAMARVLALTADEPDGFDATRAVARPAMRAYASAADAAAEAVDVAVEQTIHLSEEEREREMRDRKGFFARLWRK